MSSASVNIISKGEFIISLDNLHCCLIVLSIKKCFIFHLNFPTAV